jgi:hypothetical protein
MRVLCHALTDEHSAINWLIFDWDDDMQKFAEEYQRLIKETPALSRSDFLHFSFINYGCTAIESIDEDEADDGLIQAKWKLENDRLEFVYLDDRIDVEKGVTVGRLSVPIILVDAKHVVWNLYMKYEEGSVIESPPFNIPVRNAGQL